MKLTKMDLDEYKAEQLILEIISWLDSKANQYKNNNTTVLLDNYYKLIELKEQISDLNPYSIGKKMNKQTNKQTDEEKTINFLNQMTNEDLKELSEKVKESLIKTWSKWVLIEDDINAVSFISNDDNLNERLEEIYNKKILETNKKQIIDLDKENNNNDFYVNDGLTINNFEIIENTITQFLKFGQMEDYIQFKGMVNHEKVKGFVSLKDDNIYKLECVKK